MPTSINLGKVRPTDKGEWSSTYEGGYDILDIVTSGKGSYISKVKLNTAELSDRTKWVPFVDSDAIEEAIQEANEAAGLADQARLAIEGNLAKLELADAEHSSQIKSIENVLSTANLGQSAQLSVSGRKVVSLPKNASNGGMSVKLEGLTAKNLVVNGDFRNGLTGLVFSPEIINKVLVGDVLSFTATAAGNYAGVYVSVVIGRKYYIQTTFKSTSNQVLFSLAGVSQIAHSGGGGFETKSTILSWASPTGNYVIRVQDLRTSGWDEIQIKGGNSGLICIDLTAIFGAGNEPTKEQCDLIFSDHFEGVKSFVPTGRVRSARSNILNYDWVKNNRYIYIDGASAGTAYAFTGRSTVEKYIPLITGKLLRVTRTADEYIAMFWYNDLKQYISTSTFQSGVSGLEFIATPPAGAKYFRLCYPGTRDTFISRNFAIYFVNAGDNVTRGYKPYGNTSLYLTSPELRSNGAVKDEIRKGANGYELVKMVGVGTLTEKIVGGNFEDGLIGTNDAGDGVLSWVLNTTSPISGTKDGRLVISSAGTFVYKPRISFPSQRVSGQWRILTFDYRVNSGACRLYAINIGATATSIDLMLTGSGKYKLIYKTNGTTDTLLSFDGTSLFDIQIDNISDKLILGVDGAISDTSTFTELPDGTILYTLATPVITPISHGGILNSAENGTVYHEPIIADAGVYSTNMPILLTDYPIASIEEIIKHENGVDTYLDVSTAVIAGDKLSFTHPSLQSGDLVLFTYSFDKESTNGNITATFYDSNVVKIDTVTGKAYKITDVVTNGVLTRTLTEV